MTRARVQAGDRNLDIGKTIFALRKQRGLSHAALAKKATELAPADAGISAKTVGNIEKGRHMPTLLSLIAIAAALDVEIWQLFLPASKTPRVVAEAVHGLLDRDEDAQRTVLELIKKIPAKSVANPSGAPDGVGPTDAASLATRVARRRIGGQR